MAGMSAFLLQNLNSLDGNHLSLLLRDSPGEEEADFFVLQNPVVRNIILFPGNTIVDNRDRAGKNSLKFFLDIFGNADYRVRFCGQSISFLLSAEFFAQIFFNKSPDVPDIGNIQFLSNFGPYRAVQPVDVNAVHILVFQNLRDLIHAGLIINIFYAELDAGGRGQLIHSHAHTVHGHIYKVNPCILKSLLKLIFIWKHNNNFYAPVQEYVYNIVHRQCCSVTIAETIMRKETDFHKLHLYQVFILDINLRIVLIQYPVENNPAVFFNLLFFCGI